MGLDTTHGCWHGAYSAFQRWRHKLAEVAGYDVVKVKYDDGFTMDTVLVDWGHLHGQLHGEWNRTPEDPLLVLLIPGVQIRIGHQRGGSQAIRRVAFEDHLVEEL